MNNNSYVYCYFSCSEVFYTKNVSLQILCKVFRVKKKSIQKFQKSSLQPFGPLLKKVSKISITNFFFKMNKVLHNREQQHKVVCWNTDVKFYYLLLLSYPRQPALVSRLNQSKFSAYHVEHSVQLIMVFYAETSCDCE